MKRDTIVALASGAGRAGIAVIRISGSRAFDVLRAMTREELPKPRVAERRVFRGKNGDSIDDGLALVFVAPHSFTGEDVVELHAHGGVAVVSALIETCIAHDDVRLAEPGEFTRRAFENGKLDLAEAEGLADLIDAETEGQRKQALRQMQGALSKLYESWRARLIEAMALLEAEIDFPDEDLPGGLADRVGPLVEGLASDIAAHLDDAHRGQRVRDGYRIAIIGAPNAGKSSLLNALARREAAIVSDIPGTTRDVVEVRLVLGGFPVWLADTAGLREAADAIEAEGVRRALERADEADLRLILAEPGAEAPRAVSQEGDILIRSKADLGRGEGLAVSARTGAGLAELEAALGARVAAALGGQEAPALTRLRHRRLLEEALRALRRPRQSLPELWAEDLRLAAQALGRLTGRIDVEDLLDEVFSSFCIGK